MTGLSTKTRRAVADRDRGMCLRCLQSGSNVHHRIGKGMGGTSRTDVEYLPALVTVCGSGTTGCHGWITEHHTLAEGTGWVIRRSDPRPAYTIPLTNLYGHTFLLTDDGQIDPVFT